MIVNVYPSATARVLSSDVSVNLRLVLLDATYTYSDTHTSYTNLIGLVPWTPAGGFTLTGIHISSSGNTSTLAADPATANSVTTTFRSYAIYQDITGKPLILHCDYGANVVLNAATLTFDLSNILTVEA